MAVPLKLDAATVARNAGFDLRAKGSRLWACCPLHGEKTASLCFYPDGRFHCFGCGAHGDAADLYAALHGVTLAEALRICKGQSNAPKPKGPTAEDLRRKLDAWRSAKWTETCKELHAAQATMSELERRYTVAKLATLPEFWEAVERKATANDTLNLLDTASMAQLLKMCTEDICSDTMTKSMSAPA